MSVRPYTEPTLEVKNKKPSIGEYFVFFSYFVVIISEIVCLYLEDKGTRLYLWDVALFIGGIRQYSAMVIIFAFIFAIFAFKYFHFTTDGRLMKWIELIEVINGTRNPKTVVFTKHLGDLRKVISFARRFNFFFTYIVIFPSRK